MSRGSGEDVEFWVVVAIVKDGGLMERVATVVPFSKNIQKLCELKKRVWHVPQIIYVNGSASAVRFLTSQRGPPI